MNTRTLATVVTAAGLALVVGAAPAQAFGPDFYEVQTRLQLPDGFQPEGIAIGPAERARGGNGGTHEPYAYVGSLADGDIYRANLKTGRGEVISQGPGTPSLGLKLDRHGRLFVAGGPGGDARVVDTDSGRVLRSYTLQSVPSMINDVVLTGGSAWFTDSINPTLFQLDIGRHAKLPKAAAAIPLTGDIAYTAGFNANGIAATPDGRNLIIVQANTGKLFHTTYRGRTTEIDLGGDTVPGGDGLWLRGRVLYVVQNRLNMIAKIQLNRSGTRGEVVSRTTDASFDFPTTIAEYRNRLYVPNARFTTPPEPTTPYTVVSVRRP